MALKLSSALNQALVRYHAAPPSVSAKDEKLLALYQFYILLQNFPPH